MEEREGNINVREKHQLAASHTPPTRDLASIPGMCPDWELNQQSFSSQAGAQSTEPHQPGLLSPFLPQLTFTASVTF